MRCKVCGGTVSKFGNKYFQCDYCNQFFGLNEEEISSDRVYSYAVERINAGTQEGCEEAIQLFSSIPQFKDSTDRVKQGYGNIERMRVEEEEKRLEDERKRIFEEKQKIETEKKTRATMRILGIAAVLVVCIIVVLVRNRTEKIEYYESAKLMFENGEYENAIITFKKTKGYLDSNEYIYKAEQEIEKIETTYRDAVSKYEAQNYEKSYELFLTIREYKDVEEYIKLIFVSYYENARELFGKGNYEKAIEILSSIPSEADCYTDVNNLLISINEAIQEKEYEEAITLYNEGNLLESQKRFVLLGNYSDSNSFRDAIGEEFMKIVQDEMENDNYADVIMYMSKIDTREEWDNYEETILLRNEIADTYYTHVYEKTIEILRADGFDAAETYVLSAKNELFLEADAKGLLNEIKPTQLIALEPYDKGKFVRCRTDFRDDWDGKIYPLNDNWGETYSSGIYCDLDPWDNTFIEYNTDEYSLLCASVICLENYKTNKKDGYIKIYGDGEIIYSSENITKGYETQNISIDISNYTILKIEFAGTQYKNGCLANPMLYK